MTNPSLNSNVFAPDTEHLDSAVLRYKFTGEKEVDLVSTTVPESFRGKGVAATLSKVNRKREQLSDGWQTLG